MGVARVCGLPSRQRPLVVAVAALCAGLAVSSWADEAKVGSSEEKSLAPVTVTADGDYEAPTAKTGLYTTRKSNAATKLPLSLRETPQTVSVVTRSQMDDFRLDSVNDLLAVTSGVIVEKVETDRTYYSARGFDITNFQVDGVGLPFTFGNVYGDLDTAIYDRVDAVYGANGLMSGTGNPSASINFVRKRPTVDFQASVGVTLGSWDRRRFEGDISGALVESGRIRGRLVVARAEGDSYLDRYSHEKNVFYGVIEADLDDATTLALGHNEQHNQAKGGMWGALPLYYTDGSPTHYDRSTSTATDWAYWHTTVKSTFAELTRRFDNGWVGKATLTHNEQDNQSALFYVYGTPSPSTGLGLMAYPSRYDSKNQQDLADVSATGKINLGGRQHDLTLGANWSRDNLTDISHYGRGIGTALPDLATWSGDYAMPLFDASVNGSAFTYKRQSAYGAARLNPADDLKIILGARATRFDYDGIAYGVSQKTEGSKVSPYAGVIYDLTRNVSAYASYTGIFNPQYQIDATGAPLKPADGKSYEVGLKSEFFDKKLNASLALFKSEQHNLAETAGYIGATAYYKGIDAYSKGFQADLSGQLTSRLQATAGYTQLSIHDKDGNDVRTYTPRRLLRLATVYRVPGIDGLKVGANLSWQSDIYRAQSGASGETRQSAYALLGLMARYEVNKHWSVNANLYNVTNEKYITSLYWDQGYYGAPMSGSLSVNWTY